MTEFSREVSPVGWYVASYLIRFVELDDPEKDALHEEFLVWENTIIIKADSLDEAYAKVVAVAERETIPYKGGPNEVPVQWVFEGVTQLLPIHEELEDGAEIMWAEHDPIRLGELRQRARTLGEIRERLNAKHT